MLRTDGGSLLFWKHVNMATDRWPVSLLDMVSSSVSVVLGNNELLIVQRTCTCTLSSCRSFGCPEPTQLLSLASASSRWVLHAQVAPGRSVTFCSLQVLTVLRTRFVFGEMLALPPTEQATNCHAWTCGVYGWLTVTARKFHSLLRLSTDYTMPSFTLRNYIPQAMKIGNSN